MLTTLGNLGNVGATMGSQKLHARQGCCKGVPSLATSSARPRKNYLAGRCLVYAGLLKRFRQDVQDITASPAPE